MPQGQVNLVVSNTLGGKRCNHVLDPLGRHAGFCNKGLFSRADMIECTNILPWWPSQAGLTAQAEQNMFVPGETLDDGEPAPGSVRPIHRADLHIIEPAGSELWLGRAHSHCRPGTCLSRANFSEKNKQNAEHMARDMGVHLQPACIVA